PYPDRQAELDMVRVHGTRTGAPDPERMGLTPICDLNFILAVRQIVQQIRLADEMAAYVVDLVRATRSHSSISVGASPRAATMLAAASRAAAALEGRDFVIPDDVKTIFRAVMRHRVVLAPGAEIDGRTVNQALGQIVEQVPAPR